MPMTTEAAVDMLGLRVSDQGGNPIGRLEGVYVDRTTRRPVWLVASTGTFGSRSVLVPAAETMTANGMVMLAVNRGEVRSAPRHTLAMAPLAAVEDRALARHYRHVGRLRQISDALDHQTTAHPVIDIRAIARGRAARFALGQV
jgi:hypothetical protein